MSRWPGVRLGRWAPSLRTRVALAVWLGVVLATWLCSSFAVHTLTVASQRADQASRQLTVQSLDRVWFQYHGAGAGRYGELMAEVTNGVITASYAGRIDADHVAAGRLDLPASPAWEAYPGSGSVSGCGQALRLGDRTNEPPNRRWLATDDCGELVRVYEKPGGTYFAVGPVAPAPAFVANNLVSELRDTLWVLGVVLSTLAALAAWLVAGAITRPALRTGEVARRLGGGDLSARVRITGNDDISQLGLRLNEMADSLQAMIATQRHFVSDTAHELRTPTAALLASASALENPATRDEAAAIVAPQARRLASLTEDLLQLARFDDHREHLDLRETDLVGLVRSAVGQLGAERDVRVWADGGVVAVVDPTRVTTIVRNLVANALRHGGVPVTVVVSRHAGIVRLRVDDTGPGVPVEIRATLFDRFVRGDASRHGGGAGLGLAIARENAELHGGSLTVGEDGHGFLLVLPADAMPPDRPVATTPTQARRSGWRDRIVPGLLFVGLGLAFGGGLLGPLLPTPPGVNAPMSRSWLVTAGLVWIVAAGLGLLMLHLVRGGGLLLRATLWSAAMLAFCGLASGMVASHWGLWGGVLAWGFYLFSPEALATLRAPRRGA